MAARAIGADVRDHRERNILGGDAGRGLAADGHAHAPRLLLPQRLRHQHMSHFGRADAEGVSAEGAMRRGVAVAAHDQQSRQCQALFGTDDVNDALARIAQAKKPDAIAGGVGFELADHVRDRGVGDRAVAPAGRHVMVGDAEGERWLGHRSPALSDLIEGKKRAFVHVVTIHPEQRGAILAARDFVRRPELVDDGLRCAHARQLVPGPRACKGCGQYCTLKNTK